MINPLLLPEIREMLAAKNVAEMREFCEALNPVNTAEFMEGLTSDEAWEVLQCAEPTRREEIFSKFPPAKQLEILESQDRHEMAGFVAEMPSDDRVDLLRDADTGVVAELMPLLPDADRKEILQLQSYPEGSAGSVMSTEFAKLSETLTVRRAMEELSNQAEHLETIYYLYVIDQAGHLRGVVSARQLVSAIGKPNLTLGELMETDVASVNVKDDQEEVARRVARFDLLAIPVVDDERRILGIVTHDDVIDVLREEATEDAHLAGAVAPLDQSYLLTPILTLSWKRGMWLTILFATGLLTAFALRHYQEDTERFEWLVLFIPLIISSGGNSGSQSATLIVTALATGDVRLRDWMRVVRREFAMGLVLGGFLATLGFLVAAVLTWRLEHAAVVAVTLLLVVASGAMCGSTLPLVFRRFGWDPALMSNPFVAGIVDILGILIYMNVAITVMSLIG